MPTRKTNQSQRRIYDGKHRFEHWYRDNQVYFITARCNNKYPAFAAASAKEIFWDRFDHYVGAASFTPWVTSLLDNHYHCLGYLKHAADLGPMMKRLHGSVAKLVNDQLAAAAMPSPALTDGRLLPFFHDGRKTFFDGCIRSEKQARLAYRYTIMQCKRHNICDDPQDYPHTRVHIELERAIRHHNQLGAYLIGVPYKRYQTGQGD